MGESSIERALDFMAIRYLAVTCRQTVPRGDLALAESAFLSEIAGSELIKYFPFLRTRRRKGARSRRKVFK